MERVWKRGDAGPDGRLFWKRAKTYAGGIRWVSEHEFERLKQKTLEQGRAHVAKDPERRTRVVKAWKEANPEKVKADWATWYAKNSAEVRRKQVERNRANPEYGRRYAKEWRRNNPEKAVAQVVLYKARARASKPGFVVMERLRGRIRVALRRAAKVKGSLKPSRAADSISVAFLLWLAERKGIDRGALVVHQIDHLYPVAWWLENRSPEEFHLVNSPENVRWLHEIDNAAKGAALPSSEEVAEHLLLVEEWRNSFHNPEKVP